MSFNMPLEYVAVAVLFSSLGTAAFLLCVLYAKGYLGRKPAPPRAATPYVSPLPSRERGAADPLGVEEILSEKAEAEARVEKAKRILKTKLQMMESGLSANG